MQWKGLLIGWIVSKNSRPVRQHDASSTDGMMPGIPAGGTSFLDHVSQFLSDGQAVLDQIMEAPSLGLPKSQRRMVNSPIRDNFYQSSSYYASTFALITTVDENGQTNIGPYQLCFPFEVCGDVKTLMLIARPDGNTVKNIYRTKKCCINYIDCTADQLENVVAMGYPGRTTQDKMQDNCFALGESPTPGRQSNDMVHPKILRDAVQVYECTWLEERNLTHALAENRGPSAHIILRLDNILMQEHWKENLEDDGGRRMPRLPITLGFRGGTRFWFAQLARPFWKNIPTNKGAKHEVIMYEANRIDEGVSFTEEACKQLVGIPGVFLRPALRGIIAQAKDEGVSEVDLEFVLKAKR